MKAPRSQVKHALVLVAGFAVAFALYTPSLEGGFVSDDVLYVEHNPNLPLPPARALPSILLAPYFANWSPLHHLLLYGEWQLFGASPAGYRVVNVLLHALAGCALLALASRAGLPRAPAGLAGALFLVHPVAAEAVAWINQSKTLLATLFGLLATERWLAHLEAPSRGRLAVAFASALLALLAKPAAVFLPIVWALAVFTHARGARRELPWAALLGVPAGIVLLANLQAQASEGGVVSWYGGSPEATARVLPWVLWRYVRLSIVPVGVVHGVAPDPVSTWLDSRVLLPLLGLLASSAALILAVRRCPRLALAAGWFVLALLPVIQLVPMTTVFADRYLYVALPGALALACDAFGTWLARAHGARRTITLAALAVLLVALAVGTRERSRLWANPEALYAEAVAAYPAGRAGWVGLGAERHRRNDPEGAAAAYLRALALDPNDGHVRHLLGRARLLQERLGEALYDLEEALRLAPRHHDEAWTRATARRLRSQGVQPEEDHE